MEETLDNSTLPTNNTATEDSTKRFNNIIKSPQDKREYRGLVLENDLKVLLISDPTTKNIASAAMNVSVGHMSDPDEIPGLAHFCEHMLFLGTEKYPNENDFSNYLGENGGYSNAGTDTDNTTYFFNIIPDKLERALDIFANFFICPLFSESATNREMNSVNSEYEKNIPQDYRRVYQINKTLSNPDHSYKKFGTGNLKTLAEDLKANEIDLRSELIKFHQKWYSANIMTLALFGKETLDELEEIVVSKFSSIVNKNVTAPRWTEHPYDQQKPKKIFIVPVKDSRTLTLEFPTADMKEFYKSGPEEYLKHLIGYKGKGSLLSELRAKGWCNKLTAEQIKQARGFGKFEIEVDLTIDGLENIDEIVKIIFQYLNRLREVGPQKHIFDEYCSLNQLEFRFHEKIHPVTLVCDSAEGMPFYPLMEILTARTLKSEWRPNLITELLNNLIPQCVRVIIIAQKNESICEETEYWYGTKYHTEIIDDETIQNWKDCGLNVNLHLPEPNLFIATDFDLIPIESTDVKHPIIIYDTPTMRVWFKQDSEFLQPKTIMNFDFNNPIVYSDPLNYIFTTLFVQLFNDQLNEYLYSAKLAGVKLELITTQCGIRLSISGYSHKQKVLLQKVLDQMFTFIVDPKRFEILKEKLQRTVSNFKAEEPDWLVTYYVGMILMQIDWTIEEIFDAFSMVTVERLQPFTNEFLSRIHVECLIYGNVNQEKALEMSNLVEEKLNSTDSVTLPLLCRQLNSMREIKLPKGQSYLFEAKNEFHTSSCVELYLQCGLQNDNANVFTDLTQHILNEPCYTVLRTQEQLGYIVESDVRKENGVQGIQFIVQSKKHPVFVEERIELFIESMEAVLDKMSDDEFERYKEALASEKLKKPKSVTEQNKKFLNEISNQQYHFDRAHAEFTILSRVSKQQLIDYYKTFIKRGGSSRRTLVIHILSIAEGGAGHADSDEFKPDTISPHIAVKELSTFKSSKELYPLVQPYKNIQPKGGKSKL